MSAMVIFGGRVWGGAKFPAHIKYKRRYDFISIRFASMPKLQWSTAFALFINGSAIHYSQHLFN